MPGGGGSSTTVQKADPWSGVQPYLTDQYATVNALANSGILPYYPGETYAPFNPLQIGGQYATLDYAQNRFQPGVGTLQQALGSNINQQRDPASTNPYAGHYQAMFNQGDPNNVRAWNPYQSQWDQMGNVSQTMAQNPNQGWLNTMFNSPSGVASNPQLQAVMDSNARNVTNTLQRDWLPGIRSNAAMAGQYGGSKQGIAEGLAMGEASKALADANASSQMNAWNTAMGQRSTAANLSNQNFANALSQRSTAAGLNANNLANAQNMRTAGANLMSGTFGQQLQASNQALSQMPQALQLGFMGPQQAMNIGQMQQDQYNRSIQEQMARYYYPEQVAWERQGQLANILAGAQPYRSQTTQGPGSNPLAGAIGGAATGAGIAGGLAQAGLAVSNPVGWALTGLGAAGGLFGG